MLTNKLSEYNWVNVWYNYFIKIQNNWEQDVELLYFYTEAQKYSNLINDSFSANLKRFYELKLFILLIREIESK